MKNKWMFLIVWLGGMTALYAADPATHSKTATPKKILLLDNPAEPVSATPTAKSSNNSLLWDQLEEGATKVSSEPSAVTPAAPEKPAPAKATAAKGTAGKTHGKHHGKKNEKNETAAVAKDPFAATDGKDISADLFGAVSVEETASSPANYEDPFAMISEQPIAPATTSGSDTPAHAVQGQIVTYGGASEAELMRQASANKSARLKKEAEEEAARRAAQAQSGSMLDVLGGAVLGMAMDTSLNSVIGDKLSDTAKQAVVEKTVTVVSGNEQSVKTYKQIKGIMK